MIESGRDRSRRIDTNYHRKVDASIKLKRIYGLLALVVGLGLSVWFVYASISARDSGAVSTGALASAHAFMGDSDCLKCHTANVPIRSDAVWGKDLHHVAANNQKCDACHASAGHFVSHTRSDVLDSLSCSECHREHLGKQTSLVLQDDLQCIRCHENLSAVAKIAGQRKDATSFSKAGGHPEFRSLTNDPGTIAFSHAQHMRPGQAFAADDKSATTLARIPSQFRHLYRANSQGLVQLDCADCHSPDSAWPKVSGSTLGSRANTPDSAIDRATAQSLEPPADQAISASTSRQAEHRYFQPVEFDRHCVGCHQLPLKIQHGLDRAATIEQIQRAAAVTVVQQHTPGDLATASTQLADRVAAIFGQGKMCAKCHQLESDQAAGHIVRPSNIPARWLQGARFSHAAHRDHACSLCHADAHSNSPPEANQPLAQRVMIGGLNVCVKCHISDSQQLADRSSETMKNMTDGACVTCHRYHLDPPNAIDRRASAEMGRP